MVLVLVGLAVILLKVAIPEPLSAAFEFGAGMMLLTLGGSLAWSVFCERRHVYTHRYGDATHLHLHRHRTPPDHGHAHWLRVSFRPFCIGMVHGLAGSAALMLIVFSGMRTAGEGIAYILIFGIGSIAGMMLLGLLISCPFILSASFGRHVHLAVQGLASLGSMGVGLIMMLRIALGSDSY
jgi:hypothetical protein